MGKIKVLALKNECELCSKIDSCDCSDEGSEEREKDEYLEMAESCTCGAWIVRKKGKVLNVADCLCGNGL